jgi:hypothetical protein
MLFPFHNGPGMGKISGGAKLKYSDGSTVILGSTSLQSHATASLSVEVPQNAKRDPH